MTMIPLPRRNKKRRPPGRDAAAVLPRGELAYGWMESAGFVVMTPVMVQAPAIATFLKRILPSMIFTGTVFGPQLPIGEVNDTLRMLTFVALLAGDFHGRP